MSDSTEALCPECGVPGVANAEACGDLFAEVGSREFSDGSFFCVHRLSVDAYCLQHPGVYMKPSKSAATHLAAMCWFIEYGASKNLPKALKRWVDGPWISRVSPRLRRCVGAF